MRCITVTNYNLRKQSAWINLLAAYAIQPDHIFLTEHLTDRLFDCGFRVVNPEFKAPVQQVMDSTQVLTNILQDWDSIDETDFHNYTPNHSITPKQRAILAQASGRG